ncbi:sigma-54 dependent transcriptional regulator [bacterium]|nr:sigma-54 dependent transcriptional regulator [bacterium]MBU1676536.1 sigma-54 dependent transcriptional regulator [bacterium]
MKAAVLIIDDDATLRKALEDRFAYWGHVVDTAADGDEALGMAARETFDLILLDLSMPGLSGLEVLERLRAAGCRADIVVLTAHGSVRNAVEALKAGADDFLTKPSDFELLKRVVDRSLEHRRLRRANQALAARDDGAVIGESAVMANLLATAARAAKSDATVVLRGESGTGKGMLAEYVHRASPRARGPFVYVNCVAISDELIESTLFGHERGAFTGAVRRKDGRLEAAGGGTAFLDEIGDISANLQTKLLHFLETGQFERVGGNQTVRVDCRIIAATNRDLHQEIAEGRFREDLYYRLNVISLDVPPLRERAGDIVLLAGVFLKRFGAELKRGTLRFAGKTLEIMNEYAWPGNVRQLKNAVERMVVLTPSDVLSPGLLPPEILSGAPMGARTDPAGLHFKEAVNVFKRRFLGEALSRAGGNQTRAAKDLGLQRSYLNKLLKELGVRAGPDRRDG